MEENKNFYEFLNLENDAEYIDSYIFYEDILFSIIKEDSVITIWNLLNMFSVSSNDYVITEECILDSKDFLRYLIKENKISSTLYNVITSNKEFMEKDFFEVIINEIMESSSFVETENGDFYVYFPNYLLAEYIYSDEYEKTNFYQDFIPSLLDKVSDDERFDFFGNLKPYNLNLKESLSDFKNKKLYYILKDKGYGRKYDIQKQIEKQEEIDSNISKKKDNILLKINDLIENSHPSTVIELMGLKRDILNMDSYDIYNI